MNKEHSVAIADLLNRRNELDVVYSPEKILKSSENYEFHLNESGKVIAAVEIERVQWYQWEIRHLSVHESHLRMGHGTRLITSAEQKAVKGRARIIQCTIREDNEESKNLFQKNGYRHVSTFYNYRTENNVGIWQKILCESTNA